MKLAFLLWAALVGIGVWMQGPPRSLAVAVQEPKAGNHYSDKRVRKKPPDCTIPFFMGVDHYQKKDLNAAIIDFSCAAACNPSFVEAKIALGDAFVAKGDDRRALEAYHAALKLRPYEEDALRPAAELCLRLESNAQAIPLLETLVRLHPADTKTKTYLGIAYAATGQFQKAGQKLTEVHRIAPNDPAALVALGALGLKTGRARSAIPLLLGAVRIVPDQYKPHFLLGSAYNCVGEFPDAVKELEIAAKLEPHNAEVQYQLAQAYEHLGFSVQRQEAIRRFKALKEQSKENSDLRARGPSLLHEAESLAKDGKYMEAIEFARKALSLDPGDDRVISLIANLYYDADQLDLARRYAQEAVTKAPSEWSYHYLLGLIEEATGQMGPAHESFEIAVRLNPRCAKCYDRLGELAIRTHDSRRTVEKFERAVELDRANSGYKVHLHTAYGAADQKP